MFKGEIILHVTGALNLMRYTDISQKGIIYLITTNLPRLIHALSQLSLILLNTICNMTYIEQCFA
jgi:hypothetical protein